MNKAMRVPRKAKPLGSTEEAWFYVNPGSIEIYCAIGGANGGSMACKLTRQQVERALEIMRAASPQQTGDA